MVSSLRMPSWFDVNTLYIFKFQNNDSKGIKSSTFPYTEIIHLSNVRAVQILPNKHYGVFLFYKERALYFSFKTAGFALNFYNHINNCVRSNQEEFNSLTEEVSHNVDIFFMSKKGIYMDEIVSNILMTWQKEGVKKQNLVKELDLSSITTLSRILLVGYFSN